MSPTVDWLPDPEEHDFPAAADYLSLLMPQDRAAAVVDQLRKSATVHRRAKDILRAARLELLTDDNPHVRHDLAKIHDKRALSPVLLVRGDAAAGRNLLIADGYHRVCASYLVDENTPIACRIADLPA